MTITLVASSALLLIGTFFSIAVGWCLANKEKGWIILFWLFWSAILLAISNWMAFTAGGLQ